MFKLARSHWHTKIVLDVLVALLCLGVILSTIISLVGTRGAGGDVQALVSADEWRADPGIPRFPNPVDGMEIPQRMSSSPNFVLWRSWAPDIGGVVGEVSTAPFTPAPFMAVPILGFPNELVGTRIYIRCEATSQEWDIASARTNTQWSTVYLNMSEKDCGSQISLHAVNSDSRYYVGIGTPFRVNGGDFAAHNGFGLRATVILLTWLGVVALIVLTNSFLAIRDESLLLPVGLLSLSVAGMVALTTYIAPVEFQVYGRYIPLFFIGISLLYIIFIVFYRNRSLQIYTSTLVPLLAWLLVALFYAAIISSGDNGAGSWSVNGFFSPARWSTDNQLPYLFAEDLFRGKNPADISWGPWLAADRTPLLTGLLLIVRATIIPPLQEWFGADILPTAYMMASILFLTSWVPVLFWISRIALLRNPALILVLACTSPFFFFNSVFVWAKILGGVYAILAFGLLHQLSRGRVNRYALVLVACCACASYLSHASNAFALVPIALYFSFTILRGGLSPIAVGVAFAFLIASPWLYWLKFIQPGGSSLMRYFLTGDFGFDRRDASVVSDVIVKYQDLGLAGVLREKWKAVAFMFDLNANWSTMPEVPREAQGIGLGDSSRTVDFFILGRSIWIAVLAPVLLRFFFVKGDKAKSSLALEAGKVGLFGIALSLLLSLAPSYTHHQAYGSVLLMIIFGAITASKLRTEFQLAICAASTVYFAVVWIALPIHNLPTIWWDSLVVTICLAILLAVVFWRLTIIPAKSADLQGARQ